MSEDRFRQLLSAVEAGFGVTFPDVAVEALRGTYDDPNSQPEWLRDPHEWTSLRAWFVAQEHLEETGATVYDGIVLGTEEDGDAYAFVLAEEGSRELSDGVWVIDHQTLEGDDCGLKPFDPGDELELGDDEVDIHVHHAIEELEAEVLDFGIHIASEPDDELPVLEVDDTIGDRLELVARRFIGDLVTNGELLLGNGAPSPGIVFGVVAQLEDDSADTAIVSSISRFLMARHDVQDLMIDDVRLGRRLDDAFAAYSEHG